MAEFKIYIDDKNKYRWKLLANKIGTLAESHVGFKNKAEREENIKVFKRVAPEAHVCEEVISP